jgi:hypothetical protein
MALILDLPDETEAALRAKTSAQGVSAEQYVAQILEIDLGQATVSRPFWKTFTLETEALPDDVLDRLPRDGASEHDHYLYGSPKRDL